MNDLTHIDLFSGIGGFSLAAGWAGFRTIAFCEIEPFCQEVLKARFGAVADTEGARLEGPDTTGGIRSGGRVTEYDDGPLLIPDIRDFNGTRFRGATLLTGGFPCQPFSHAGKREGRDDKQGRHLWPEMCRVIAESHPRWVIAENVPGLISIEDGLVFEQVCVDLEGEGYEVQAFIIPACGVSPGAPHRRDRVWIIAHASGTGTGEQSGNIYGRCSEKTIGEVRLRDGVDSTDSDAPISPCGKSRLKAKQEGREDIGRGSGEGGDARDSIGGQLPRTSDGTVPQGTNPNSIGSSWDIPWIEVATRFCGTPHGLSDWLYRNRRGLSAKTAEKITRQDLPYLWAHLQQEEVYERLGGCEKIPVKENVFAVLWQFFTESIDPSLSTESAEAQEAMLRNVWHDHRPGCSPQRYEYQEQRARELEDTLPLLSYEVAFQTKQLVQKYAKQRVARLKALGNAIVPAVAYQIIKAIAEIERGMT